MLLNGRYYTLQAEESSEDSSGTGTPAFDKDELNKLIKDGVQSSIAEAMNTARAQGTPTNRQNSQLETEDPFEAIVSPIVTRHTNASNIRAQAAEDKVDFYSSEYWLTELDELLPGDDEKEIKAAKATIRANLEKTFTEMLQAGKGTFRKDIIDFELGKYIRENKTKVQESYVKRSSAKKEQELNKARRAVDISTGVMSNFQPQDIHAMDTEKMLEQFGNVAF